jgi:UDP-4-amino-4,6-dideoxy-N-acetyl-beta-L-altrosamine transaminase
MIPYGRQEISEADIQAVVETLRGDFITQGPAVPAFENAVASRCTVSHGVAVSNATAALHLACLALGVGPGDVVWTSPITFLASANCARYCGAEVDFVDIDPKSWNLSVDCLAVKLAQAEAAGRLPKVVIPVHLGGQPCDMAAIRELSLRYGFKVIEDASHAIGGSYRGSPIGSCEYSDFTVFSFHPVKIITTGEGGMAMTRDAELARKVRLLRSHGMVRETAQLERAPDGPWYYEQQELGYNYRLTDLQAALGLSQLGRLEDFLQRREALARRYDRLLAELPVATPWHLPQTRSGLHLYVIRLRPGEIAQTHSQVFAHLRAADIGVNLHYMPVYLQPYYRRLGFKPGHCPEAERYYEQAISLPMFPGLTHEQQDYVVASLKSAVSIRAA